MKIFSEMYLGRGKSPITFRKTPGSWLWIKTLDPGQIGLLGGGPSALVFILFAKTNELRSLSDIIKLTHKPHCTTHDIKTVTT